MKRKSLGRGLEALIPEPEIATEENIPVINAELDKIKPGEHQPRKSINDKGLAELASSIKCQGVIQPILLKKEDGGGYGIIAGERRWRAAKLAGLTTIPAIVKGATRREIIELALIENIQRHDLNPIEEAQAYQNLLDEHKLTQEELSQRVGKERATISNYLRLLKLPQQVKDDLLNERISMGHARVIAGIGDYQKQTRLSKMVFEKGITVRQLERMASGEVKKSRKREVGSAQPAEVLDIEEKLKRSLGTKVRLFHSGRRNRGKIQIEYYSLKDLDRLLELLL